MAIQHVYHHVTISQSWRTFSTSHTAWSEISWGKFRNLLLLFTKGAVPTSVLCFVSKFILLRAILFPCVLINSNKCFPWIQINSNKFELRWMLPTGLTKLPLSPNNWKFHGFEGNFAWGCICWKFKSSKIKDSLIRNLVDQRWHD